MKTCRHLTITPLYRVILKSSLLCMLMSVHIMSSSAQEKNAQIKASKEPTKTSQIKASQKATDPQKTAQKTAQKTLSKQGDTSTPSKKTQDQTSQDATNQAEATQQTATSKLAPKSQKTPQLKAKRKLRKRARRIRDTALTLKKGSWSIGLFNPLKVQFASQWGLEVHPLVALLSAPHMKLWHRWWSGNQMTLTGLYGFSTPSWSLQEKIPFGLAGYLSPSCAVREKEPTRAPQSCQRPGFDLVPQLGARLSGFGENGVWTLEVDFAAGAMISGQRSAPLDAPIPVDLAYAPTTHHYRAHFGARYAHRVAKNWSIQGGFDAYLTGQPDPEVALERDPLTLAVSTSFDWSITRHLTLTLGMILWRGDQRAFELVEDSKGFVTKEATTSLELYPTFDLIWHY